MHALLYVAHHPWALVVVWQAIVDYVHAAGGAPTVTEVEAHLQQIGLGDVSAATYVAYEFGGLLAFVDAFEAVLRVERRVTATGTALHILAADRPSGTASPIATAPVAERTESSATDGSKPSAGERSPPGADGAGAVDGTSPPAEVDGAPVARADEAAVAAVFGTAEQMLPREPGGDARRDTVEGRSRRAQKGAPPNGVPRAGPATAARSASMGRGSASSETDSATGRCDGALLVDGSLLELLEADAFGDVEPPVDGRGVASSTRRDGTRRDGADATTGRAAMSVADLAHMTVPQLKLELRARHLSASGTKPSLLRRLLEAFNDEARASGSGGHDVGGRSDTPTA